MLWQAEVAKGPPGVSCGGKALGTSVRSAGSGATRRCICGRSPMTSGPEARRFKFRGEPSNNDTIVASFPVEAEGKDRSTVILVTPMFTTDFADLSVKGTAGGAASVDESRSY